MDPALRRLMEDDGGETSLEAILHLAPGAEPPPGVRLVARFGDIVTCRLPREAVERTWADSTVLSLKAARPFGVDPQPGAAQGPASRDILEREGAESSGADDPEPVAEELTAADLLPLPSDLRRPGGLAETGRGVVVGIVDWGFDFAHPNFRQADGSTRALALWDQSASGPGPEPYGYGRVFEREEIDRALRSEEPYEALGYHPASGDPGDRGAHGTHVLDIAAGNGRAEDSPMGLAPDADLLFVHLASRGTGGRANLGDSVTLLEALDWIAQRAGDRPWVVNLSVGRHGGPHNGLTLVEQGIDALLAEAPGRAVVQSAGNYYSARTHASGVLRPGQERILGWRTDDADLTVNELEVWYPGKDVFAVSLAPPTGGREIRVRLGGDAPVEVDGERVGHLYHRAHDPAEGDHHIDIFLEPSAPAGRWELTLRAEEVVDGRFHAWVERDAACSGCQSRLDPADADPGSTTGTIANGFRAIAVGAFDAHDPDRALTRFSSSGPTRDGRIKPDLVAPGARILAARSASRRLGSDTPLLTRLSGTSMAAPHVTGTTALIFEAAGRPLAIHETRSVLLGSAEPVEGSAAEALRLGSGFLDVEATVEAARRLAHGTKAEDAPAEAPAELVDAPLTDGEIELQGTPTEEPAEDLLPVERDLLLPGLGQPFVETADAESSESEALSFDNEGSVTNEDFVDDEGLVDDEGMEQPLEGHALLPPVFVEPDSERRATEHRATGCCSCLGEDASPSSTAELLEACGEAVTGSPHLAASAAGLFDALWLGETFAEALGDRVEIVAWPGHLPASSPRGGDLLLTRALGEGGLGRAAWLADDLPWESSQLEAIGLAAAALPGSYFEVEIEGSASPRPVRVLDPGGRLPLDRLLLRPRAGQSPASEDTPATCTCTPGRKYANAKQSHSNLTGIKGKIKTRYGKPCCQGTASTSGYQVAYANISKSGSTLRWAQSGWGAERNPGSTSVSKYRYAEMRAGSAATAYKVKYDTTHPPAEGASHLYECDLDPATGKWIFRQDGSQWKTFSHNGWKTKGDSLQWTGEIFNKEDDMPGTAADKCRFSECKFRQSGGSYQNAALTASQVSSKDASEWGASRVSATAFDIWDKKPNP